MHILAGFKTIFSSPKFWKAMFTIAVIAALSIGGYFIFDAMGFTNADEISDKLSDLGIWLYVIYICLFVVQAVLLSFIPGNTTLFITAGFIMFGGDIGITFLVGSIAIIFGSMALYCVGRFGGRKLMFWLFGKESVEKQLNWIGEKGTKAVPWLFLIPLMPTDLICLICGASRMSFWKFMLIVIVFRPIEVLLLISYNYIIPIILEYDPLIILLLINVAIINLVLLFIYYKAIVKLFNKYTEPLINPFRRKPIIGKCDCEKEPGCDIINND